MRPLRWLLHLALVLVAAGDCASAAVDNAAAVRSTPAVAHLDWRRISWPRCPVDPAGDSPAAAATTPAATSTTAVATATPSMAPLVSFEEWKMQQQQQQQQPPPVDTAASAPGSHDIDDTPEEAVDVLKNPKKRFNYASFDCGAVVLAANAGAQSATAILSENKDAYLLNGCDTQDKFVVVELCDEIWVDTVVLGNFEFFSSMFREVRVSVADRYPPPKNHHWQSVGVFTAKNERKAQAFAVTNPVIWAKYLRVDFLTHYGNEFYCPVSLLRVYGRTMMDDLRKGDEPTAPEKPPQPLPVDVVTPTGVPTTTIPNTSLPGGGASQNQGGSDERLNQTHIDQALSNATLPAAGTPPNVSHPELKNSTADTRAIQTIISTTEAKTVIAAHSSPSGKEPVRTIPPPQTALNLPTATHETPSASPAGIAIATSGITAVVATAEPTQPSPPPPIAPPSVPEPQSGDNFFKVLAKRVQKLEENATLTQTYLTEQSRRLQALFTELSNTYRTEFAEFISTSETALNSTLRSLGEKFGHWWQAKQNETNESQAAWNDERARIQPSLQSLQIQIVCLLILILIQGVILGVFIWRFVIQSPIPSGKEKVHGSSQTAVTASTDSAVAENIQKTLHDELKKVNVHVVDVRVATAPQPANMQLQRRRSLPTMKIQ